MQLNLPLLVHILQPVKEPVEEEAGSAAGDSGGQVDPGSAEQAEDQLAAPGAADVTGEELQQVCDLRLDSEWVLAWDPPAELGCSFKDQPRLSEVIITSLI